MNVENLEDNRVEDFINYCKNHRGEVDDTFLYDEDLENFKLNEGNITYILVKENSEEIIGAISLITNLNYVEKKKSRLRIFHSQIENIEAYAMMLTSLVKDIKDTEFIFIFANGEDKKVLKDLKN